MEVKQGEQSVRPENCLSSLQQPEAHNNFRNAEYYLFPAAVLPIFFFSLDFFFGSFMAPVPMDIGMSRQKKEHLHFSISSNCRSAFEISSRHRRDGQAFLSVSPPLISRGGVTMNG
jgi:hypothetical protein